MMMTKSPANKALMIGALAVIGYATHMKYPPKNPAVRQALPILGGLYAVAAWRA